MGSLTISNKILDKYIGYLKDLDITAKKLIIKLTQSIETKSIKKPELRTLWGHGKTIGILMKSFQKLKLQELDKLDSI